MAKRARSGALTKERHMLDINQIKEIIPHRYPFLLIDKVIEMEEGKSATAIKNVTADEPYFVGHFPDYPVMPGVLIVEALAQTGAVCVLSMRENKGKLAFFASINNCKFRQQVIPGDTLTLSVEVISLRNTSGKAKAVAKVGDKIACEAEIMFMLGNK